jgi:uncharacterized protein YjbJ (UPF0337 family)
MTSQARLDGRLAFHMTRGGPQKFPPAVAFVGSGSTKSEAAQFPVMMQSSARNVSRTVPTSGTLPRNGTLSGIPTHARRKPDMDKDRIKGSAEQAKGAVKEAVGKVTGDSKLEAEGKGDKAAGKVQNAIGGLKDTLRGK